MKVGVIDIGTLKIKFLVVDVDASKKITTKYESNTLTCLGVRMHENNNKPHEDHLQETINELKRCGSVLGKEKVDKIKVVSTHALREMGNVGYEVAERINKETDLKVEIITQEEEANLFFKAVMLDFKTDKDFTVVDVGGGSVQVLIGNKNKLKEKYLLKTGAQYLFDRFSPRHTGNDHPTREEIRAMQEYLMKQLLPIPNNTLSPVIYGSSCVIDVFKKIGIRMQKYYLSKSHPYRVDISEIENFTDKIIPIPYDQREKQYGLHQKYYMWGIEKAFLNIISVSQKVGSPFIIPSNSNINQGLILSMI